MATALQQQLRNASFRGVAFFVEPQSGIGLGGGRRLQVNEYPQRDIPYVQDLGRSARNIEFEAFVVGADYIAQSTALLAALEKYGSGALVHPWLGTLTVNVQNYRIVYDHGLGKARLTLAFVEAGILTFPTSTTATVTASQSAANNLQTVATSRFAQVANFLSDANRMAKAALGVYAKVLRFLGNPVGTVLGLFGSGVGGLMGNLVSLGTLLANPTALANTFAGFLNIAPQALSGGLVTGASTTTQADGIYLALINGQVTMAISPTLAPVAPSTSMSPAVVQQTVNTNAILAQTRQLLISNAVGLSSLVVGTVYDDVIATRSAILGAIDAEMLAIADDILFDALTDARAAVYADLTAKARDSARLITYKVPGVMPALVVAYDQYEDATREAEIVARNHIRRPGFVPMGNLLVLSR